MQSPFNDWQRALRAARKGPFALPPIRRGLDWAAEITIEEALPASTLRGELRTGPVAESATAAFTIGVPEVGDIETVFTARLTASETAALPASDDGSGVLVLAFDLLLTPAGAAEELLMGGSVLVFHEITR